MSKDTEANVKELVDRYKRLREENNRLKSQLLASKSLQEKLEESNKALNEQLQRALMLQSTVIAEGDRAAAKKVVQSMIKEIDRCIQYLYR